MSIAEQLNTIEKSLTRMVHAASTARTLDHGLLENGFSDTPYGRIFGELADAIFYIIGENANRFEDSLTFIVLHTDAITDEAKASLLMSKYKECHA